jgi:hypothetical protein
VVEPPVRSILRHGGGDGRGRPAAPPLCARGWYFRIRICRRRDGRDWKIPGEA